MCTWRRQLESNQHSDKENDKEYRKELWCFWWGEQPPILATFKELEAGDEWCWGEAAPNAEDSEKTGLDYQSRSLLFKGKLDFSLYTNFLYYFNNGK